MSEPIPTVLPMFPLGTVLLPSAVLPLHIFEPRYRQLVADCLAGGREFGVVLIERGSEVGGGDVRTDIGTVAQFVAASELPDGRWYLVTVGTRRVRAVRWLDDDPYPRAEVEEYADPPEADSLDGARYAALLARTRRVLGLATELGVAAAEVTTDFADDPALGTFQVAASVPIGPLDRQRLLATLGSAARAELLETQLAEIEDVLQLRLRLDDGPSSDSP